MPSPDSTLTFDESTQITPPASVPVSVCIIVKDNAASLQRTLQSLRRAFLRDSDELIVLDTGSQRLVAIEDVVTNHGGKCVSRGDLRCDYEPFVDRWLPQFKEKFKALGVANGGLLDFGAARQIVSDLAAHDIQLWIDSDDEFVEEKPGTLRGLVDRVFLSGQADSIFLDYLYSFDAHDGAVTTILKRERVYDRRLYHWVGRCHETAIPRPGVSVKGAAYFQDARIAIKHCKDRPDTFSSDLRNYIILRNELEQAGSQPDPRSIFYLGNAARGLGLDAEAISYYSTFVGLSGSRDDIFAAHYYSGVIYLSERIKRPYDALDLMFKCIKVKPEDPRGYFGVARCYFQLGKNAESLHWFRVGKLLPEPVSNLHSYDPSHIHALPLQVAILAAKELGDEGQVIQLCEQLQQNRPDHPDTKTLLGSMQNWIAGRRLVESVRRVAANSTGIGLDNARAVVEKLTNVPPELEEQGLTKLEPPDERPQTNHDLSIICGHTVEPWGPNSGAKGIGGSERAVIEMAPRLQRRGFSVSVYANVPTDQRGLDHRTGVNWQHWASFDRTRPRKTVIFWRSPEGLELPISAEKRIVWCHDVQSPERWTPARIALADQVWVLSEYHATTLGPARKALGDKVIITRNGIDAALYDATKPRHKKRVIYASSPDRGVLTAIKLFQKAFEGDAEAELHIFYGFTKLYLEFAATREYGHIPDLARDVNYYEYMRMVLCEVDKDERIKWHGRKGWSEVAHAFCEGDIWLYPTRFPEISCMSAMEAQAAGLQIVSTDYAALAETVAWESKLCHKIDLNDMDGAAQVLRQCGNITPSALERKCLARAARKRFDYEALAEEWVGLCSPVLEKSLIS